MKDTASFNKHIYKRQATGSGNTLPFICLEPESIVEKKRYGVYRFSILMLSLCLVISLGGVLVMPLLAGGAVTANNQQTATNIVKEEKVSYKNTDDASAALGFIAALPMFVPEGAELQSINVVNQKIFEAIYSQKNGSELVYRMALGTEDPSGVHTDFAYSASYDISGDACMLSGGNKLTLNLAVWICGDNIYSLYLPDGIQHNSMQLLIDNMVGAAQAENTEVISVANGG